MSFFVQPDPKMPVRVWKRLGFLLCPSGGCPPGFHHCCPLSRTSPSKPAGSVVVPWHRLEKRSAPKTLQQKCLRPLGTQDSTALYIVFYQHATLPAICKQAIILPLLKPGKPRVQNISYRPISLLCPASKVL